MGHSTGGVAANTFGAALVREIFGNKIDLTVFNDAGPAAIDIEQKGDTKKRAADWGVNDLYPLSCVNCNNDDFVGGGAIGFIDWYLEKDPTVRNVFSRDFLILTMIPVPLALLLSILFYLRRSVF
jgi:hypothetical protein